jgi:peptidoglycan hydrolase CwlO-like protein
MEQSRIMAHQKLEESAMNHKQLAQQKAKLSQIEKNNKNITERADQLDDEIQKIQETIGLDFETPKFQEFCDSIAKKDDLEVRKL